MTMYKKFIMVFITSIYFMANDGCANQNIFIAPEQQLQIKASPFNFVMKSSSGKKLRVYLYAEDEQSEMKRYFSCSDGVVDGRQIVVKKGHYYLYLYDLQAKKFLPTRTQVFSDFHSMTMNVEGANFFLWSSTGKNKKDIILLSQLVACSVGNQYEAYGLSEDQSHLERYNFMDDELIDIFSGRIFFSKKNGSHVVSSNIRGYTVLEGGVVQYKFTLSNKPREIKQVAIDN